MNLNEKLQFYRKAHKLTQKELANLTGISEISIRKYEAGDRVPKFEQLQKIASVLTIGSKDLLNINLNDLKLDTVGDAMTLIYLLKERLGFNYIVNQLPDGSIDPNSIFINFKNEKVNHYLERIVTEDVMAEELKLELAGIDTENAKTRLLTDKFLLEQTKKEMINIKEQL